MFEDKSDKGADYLIFQQKIDHTDTHSKETFNQRYLQNLDYIENNKFTKCIVYIGGEGTLSSTTLTADSSYVTLAKNEKAALFALEHRFFGSSMPVSSLTAENYKLLTISQALNDLADFIKYIKTLSQASEDVKFLVVGGSYPGSLSSWFRLFYPHLTVASWSSSAPLNIKNEFPEYDSYIAEQLNATNATCLPRTKVIFDNANSIVSSGSTEEINAFKQKYNIPTETDDISALYIITDVLAAIVQYNTRYQLLDSYCNQIAEATSESQYESIYIDTYNKLLKIRGASPLDFDLMQATSTDPASDQANSRSWSWMTCNEVGWFQTASGLLRPSLINLDYFKRVCNTLFPEVTELADEEEVNNRYGAVNPRQTRVFFANGMVDPWSTLGVHYPDESIERRAVYIPGESHCADLYAYNSSVASDLTSAQEQIMSQMSAWLNEESCNGTCVHGTCIGGRCACDANYGGDKCDVEMTEELNLDIAIICAVSIPTVVVVAIIFATWIFVYRPRKALQQTLISSAL